jgi:adenosylhomocysteine nucleosidase
VWIISTGDATVFWRCVAPARSTRHARRRRNGASREKATHDAASDAPVMALAAITGLAAEARIARRIGWRAAASGGDAERTRRALAQLVAEGVSALVSFGICGGLDPALGSGALILAEAVAGEYGRRHGTDMALRAALAAALTRAGIGALAGDVLGAERAADTPARKAALHHQSGALAVDLESHLVAEAAAAAGLPFAVLRAVADPAGRALPPAALIGLDTAGRPAPGRILLSLVQQPGQLPALLRLARDTRLALAALDRAAEALGAARS